MSLETSRSREQLIAYLRESANRRGPYNKTADVDSGQAAWIGRMLTAIWTAEPAALRFLAAVYGVTEFADLSRGQFYALRDWLVAPATRPSEHLVTAFLPQALADVTAWKVTHDNPTPLDE